MGLALGTLIRHAAGAIAVLVAILFVLPGIAAALPASIEHTVEEYWPTQAGGQVTQVVRTANTLSPWAGFGVFVLFVAVLSAMAFALVEPPRCVGRRTTSWTSKTLNANLSSDDPAIGLRASLALHRLAERVEAHHVASAREKGWSWQQIGDALGVTRQSVHTKYNKESS